MDQFGVERRASHGGSSGVSIEVLDYRWTADARVVRSEPGIIVLWRMRPNRVKMTGAVTVHPQGAVGRLMIYDPRQPHIFNANRVAGSATVLECQFSTQWLARQLGPDASTGLDYLGSSLDLRNDNIDHLMRRIAQEMTKPRDDSPAILDAAVNLLGRELARHAALKRASSLVSCEIDPRVMNIFAVIAASENIPSIRGLAMQFNISTSHLRRLFHLHCDRTLHEILEEERIKRAIQLLDQPHLPLKIIAHRLGYKQASSFSQAFRATWGVTPTEYRQRRLITPPVHGARTH